MVALESGTEVGVILGGSVLLVVSLGVFCYAIWKFRQGKRNYNVKSQLPTTSRSEEETALTASERDVLSNIAAVVEGGNAKNSIVSASVEPNEDGGGRVPAQICQQALYDLAAPSPRADNNPLDNSYYAIAPGESADTATATSTPRRGAQGQDLRVTSTPLAMPVRHGSLRGHPAKKSHMTQTSWSHTPDVSYVGWPNTDMRNTKDGATTTDASQNPTVQSPDEVDVEGAAAPRQLSVTSAAPYPSPPPTMSASGSSQGSTDEALDVPVDPVDSVTEPDQCDQPPQNTAARQSVEPWVDGSSHEQEGLDDHDSGSQGSVTSLEQADSTENLSGGQIDRTGTLDRVALNSSRREAEAVERRKHMAADYAAAEFQRACAAADELETIMEEERMRKEAEDAMKYAGIEEAQKRLADLTFSFSFTFDDDPPSNPSSGNAADDSAVGEAPAIGAVGLAAAHKSKKSPPKSASRWSAMRRNSKKSYSPRKAQQTQDDEIKNTMQFAPPRADVQFPTGLASTFSPAPHGPTDKAEPSRDTAHPTKPVSTLVAQARSPPSVALKPPASVERATAKAFAVSALEPAIKRHPSLAQQGESDFRRHLGVGSKLQADNGEGAPATTAASTTPGTRRRVSAAGSFRKGDGSKGSESKQSSTEVDGSKGSASKQSSTEVDQNMDAKSLSIYTPIQLDVQKLDRALFESFSFDTSNTPPQQQATKGQGVRTNFGQGVSEARVSTKRSKHSAPSTAVGRHR